MKQIFKQGPRDSKCQNPSRALNSPPNSSGHRCFIKISEETGEFFPPIARHRRVYVARPRKIELKSQAGVAFRFVKKGGNRVPLPCILSPTLRVSNTPQPFSIRLISHFQPELKAPSLFHPLSTLSSLSLCLSRYISPSHPFLSRWFSITLARLVPGRRSALLNGLKEG